jgi:hypothetical protein
MSRNFMSCMQSLSTLLTYLDHEMMACAIPSVGVRKDSWGNKKGVFLLNLDNLISLTTNYLDRMIETAQVKFFESRSHGFTASF